MLVDRKIKESERFSSIV